MSKEELPVARFTSSLLCQISASRVLGAFGDREIKSIYFGGGTPSLLPAGFFGKVLEAIDGQFRVADDVEISCEVNPKTTDAMWFREVMEAGVNRISIGVQSFDDELLMLLGRAHSSCDAMACISQAIDAGFENTGLDFIYAIPNEGIDVLERDLRKAMSFQPRHISAYALTVENDTAIKKRIDCKELCPISEEAALQQSRLVPEMLGSLGLERYEISNFAKAGFESIHNLNYWRYGEYLGFGPGAVSFLMNDSEGFFARRWKTKAKAHAFLEGVFDISEDDRIDVKTAMFEFCFMGLRTVEGLDLKRFRRLFCKDLEDVYGKVIEELRRESLISTAAGRVKLTDRGFELSNLAFEMFVPNS
jgi:oxygen-independent coproporphyrinogen-3 oxidase